MRRLMLLLLVILSCPAGGAWGQTSRPVGAMARLQPGDRIAVKIVQDPPLIDTVRVDENGMAVLPKLGRLEVATLSAAVLQDSLRAAYMNYLRHPMLDVAVLRRVGVYGEVREPGLHLVDLTVTVGDVIARAGGFTADANPARVDLLRDGERIRVNGQGGALNSDLELRSGDRILVGRRSWLARNSMQVITSGAVIVSVLAPVIRDLLTQ